MPSAANLVRRRRARWAVPALAVAAVGAVIAGSAAGGAQATPRLPARTTAQLLAAVDSTAAWPSALTGTVQETASLGLPDLPGSDDPLSGLSLLSGTHTLKVWYDGPTRVRIALPVQLGEADLRRDGNSVWLWNSRTNQATHYLLPAGASQAPAVPAQAPPTPQQLAQQILAAVGKTTTVGLQRSITVAGQPAYQLSLAPKDSRSLIGQVRIAIDAEYSLPLQVQVFARGAASPAFSVGYTSLSFTKPAASNFAFAPPPGATVKTVTVPAGPVPGQAGAPASGSTGSSTFEIIAGNGANHAFLPAAGPVPKAVAQRIAAAFAKQLPASMSKAQRAAAVKQLLTGLEAGRISGRLPAAWTGSTASLPGGSVAVSVGVASSSAPPQDLSPSGQTVLGSGWLSVAVLPAQMPTPSPGSAAPVPAGGLAQAMIALQSAATPVHGSWGSGRLLRTSLVSVLMTNGHILIGAVRPSVLYADAAQLG
jgi:outer membrane lipoprotein-sorting protein